MSGIRYDVDPTNITSSGGVSLKASVAALAGFAIGAYTPFFSFSDLPAKIYNQNEQTVIKSKDWELKLGGLESSGSQGYIAKDMERFLIINSFALNFINSQESIPEEFEATFRKKFWDILA